jgi:hypothetical protein
MKAEDSNAGGLRPVPASSERCQMQIWIGEGVGTLRSVHDGWVAHGRRGDSCNPLTVVRIYRPEGLGNGLATSGALRVVACHRCRDRFERRIVDKIAVRIPPAHEQAAYDFLLAAYQRGELITLPPRAEPCVRPVDPGRFITARGLLEQGDPFDANTDY